MDLIWLEDCVALADTLNFSRAAELRHVTQPAFSRRIRALEQWLGTALFERGQGVQLTPAGAHFRTQASALVRSMQQLRRETLEVAGRGAPALTFAATHLLSFTFFPEWIRGRAEVAGLGAFKLVSDTMRDCEKMMVQGALQFLLCHHHARMRLLLEPSQFRSVVVGGDVLLPLCAPCADGKPRWPLAGPGAGKTPYLAYSADSGLGRILNGHAPATPMLARMAPAFTSDLAATLLAMARAGDGVAWLPRSLAARDLHDGRLVEAAPTLAALRIPIEIRLFRPAARLPRAAETLWMSLVEAPPSRGP